MNEYSVSNYSVFSNAIATTKTYGTKIGEAQTSMEEAKTTLSNEGVFMGPIQENCMQEFATLATDITGLNDNFTALSGLLDQTNAAYQKGDSDAANTILANNATSATSANALAGGTMKTYQYNGKNFNVVNTKTSIEDYQAYVKSNGLYQNAGLLDGQCMVLSQYYAKDLLTGKNTSKSTMANMGGSPATRINERVKSTNEQDVLNYTYSELSQGHPVVLQVSQVNSNKGARHLVTAVGYDSSVKSASDLNPNNILVLDCVDGEIQTLGKARSEGGHERRLFAQGGNYQALGPTDTFLSKEVTTQTTQAA